VIGRVAYLSIHTSPLEVPGTGDAGGMNVYVHQLATAMARRGVRADVFTRRVDPRAPEEIEVEPGYRVINVTAGPPAVVPTAALAEVVGAFTEGVAGWAIRHRASYDVIHTHYWLSGWAGLLLHEVLRVPLAISFHTLGRVKDVNRRADQAPAGLLRIAAEEEVIARAGCVVASTPAEAAELIEHYAARPERLCVSPPGVDHTVFFPGDRERARVALGLPAGRLVLFVARIQPLKGGDVALEAFADLAADLADLRLVVVGGPSGPQGLEEEARLHAAACAPEVTGKVEFLGPLPPSMLAAAYRSAQALVLPSRSESFGMVAVEAQACGLPVVAARVGGLAYAVAHGESGFLVEGWDPADYAAALRTILTDAGVAGRLAAGAVAHAAQYSWDSTTDRLLELYSGISSG
jgi:D-inositol-3-phosphate glycosyltransferase